MPKVKEKCYRVQQYRKAWEKEPWAAGWLRIGKTADKGYCSRCDKQINAGKSELMAHGNSKSHGNLSKQIGCNRSLTDFVATSEVSRVCAELNTVALLARKNIPFNFLDEFMSTLHFIADDSKTVKSMTCNRTKGSYLLSECLAVKAHEDLVSDLKSSNGFSILCDKATDITMDKVFCVNVRYVQPSSGAVQARLYRLIPVKEGSAEGLFTSLQKCMNDDGIPWSQVVGYASDGENLMQGEQNSFLTRIRDAVPDVYVLKCYCHSFHLVASHACEHLSRTAEQLVHDVYNYFKLSPNRQSSFVEFQHFTECEPHHILKPCQTRWLSLSQCVKRLLDQWPALELYFTSEAAEAKTTQANNILGNLKGPYIKATLEFTSFVLSDIVGLNTLFQSEEFQLHRLLPEVQRVLRMFCSNFLKVVPAADQLHTLDVDDEMKWLKTEDVYPGVSAYETMQSLKPHEKESFLGRCRDWYREAIKQIVKRVDLTSPVLMALQDVNHLNILNKTAQRFSAGILFKNLRIMKTKVDVQEIDASWRSLIIDETVLGGKWEEKSIAEFWARMKDISPYTNLAKFMLEVMALPQSTASVERTFSKINLNKTKLRNRLSVRMTEGLVKTSEMYPSNFKVDGRLVELYGSSRSNYMARYSADERESAESNRIII